MLTISLFGCKSKLDEQITLLQSSGIEFEHFYLTQRIDSLVQPFKPMQKCANITCYFFSNNDPITAQLYFIDSNVVLNVFSLKADSVIPIKINLQLNSSEQKELIEIIENTKPYSLCSIEELFVDDGYAVVVKNVYNKFNLFSVRVFSAKGKSLSQYSFIEQIASLLERQNIKVDIGK